jgi:hypothetical protein
MAHDVTNGSSDRDPGAGSGIKMEVAGARTMAPF